MAVSTDEVAATGGAPDDKANNTPSSGAAAAGEAAVAAPATAARPKWDPPRLRVKLVELSGRDQLAVRIAPTGSGSGELLVDVQPTPVFDVTVGV